MGLIDYLIDRKGSDRKDKYRKIASEMYAKKISGAPERYDCDVMSNELAKIMEKDGLKNGVDFKMQLGKVGKSTHQRIMLKGGIVVDPARNNNPLGFIDNAEIVSGGKVKF